MSEYISPTLQFNQFMNETNDGIPGNSPINIIQDYSLSPTTIGVAAPPGKILYLHRLIVHIQDVGSIDSGGYGNGAALTNGLLGAIHARLDNGILFKQPLDIAVKTNADWGMYCYDVDVKSFGQGDQFLQARWTFSKAGIPFIFDGDKGEKLTIDVADDFTGLVSHRFNCQGYLQNKV